MRHESDLYLMPPQRLAWWNPSYWFLPAQTITSASALVLIGSFFWFIRNDVNRHLFRFAFPARYLGIGVAVMAFALWQILSRRPNPFFALLWLWLLTFGAISLLYFSNDSTLPRGNPLVHAAFAAEAVALVALTPRLFWAWPLSPWLKWVSPVSFCLSLALSGVLAHYLETKVIADAKQRIGSMSARIGGISSSLEDAAIALRSANMPRRRSKVTHSEKRISSEVVAAKVSEAGGEIALLDDTTFWPPDRFDLESARLLDKSSRLRGVPEGSANLVGTISASLNRLTDVTAECLRWAADGPLPASSSPNIANTLHFLSLAGRVTTKLGRSAAFFGRESGFEASEGRMKSLPGELAKAAGRYDGSLARRWASAALKNDWRSSNPGTEFLNESFVQDSPARSLPPLLRVDKWMDLKFSPSVRYGCDPLKRDTVYTKTVQRDDPDPNKTGEKITVELTYRIANSKCVSQWSYDDGKTLADAASIETIRMVCSEPDHWGCLNPDNPTWGTSLVRLELDTRSVFGKNLPANWMEGIVQLLGSKLPKGWSIAMSGPGSAKINSPGQPIIVSARLLDDKKGILISMERESDPWLEDARQRGELAR